MDDDNLSVRFIQFKKTWVIVYSLSTRKIYIDRESEAAFFTTQKGQVFPIRRKRGSASLQQVPEGGL